MSNDIGQKEHESNAASPEHGTPSPPAWSGWTAINTSQTAETGKSAAKDMSANDSFVDETQGIQATEVLSDDDFVDVAGATGDVSEDQQSSTKSRHLQDVDDYIATEGLTGTLDQLPDSGEYTFAISDDKGYFDDRNLLFLGGTESFQVWARLMTYSSKPDEVVFLHYSFLAHQARPAHDFSRLPISMYPFRILEGNKNHLTALVRYVYSWVAGVHRPFSTEAKEVLKSALLVIGEATEKSPGGVDTILDIHSCPKLPKGFTLMKDGLSAQSVESVEISDQSGDEVRVYRSLATSSARKIFEVPSKTKPKKATKSKATPRPKAPPKAVAAETSPIQDSVIDVKASSIESDEEPTELKSRRMAKQKPKPKSMAMPKKAVPSKRQADQASLDEEDDYAQLEDLEVERNEIEKEQAEILERQADRKRDEKEDTQWMKELETRRKKIERDEGKLLKGKSARWLLAYQSQHKKT